VLCSRNEGPGIADLPTQPALDELYGLYRSHRLRFPRGIERAFRNKYFDESLTTNRIAAAIGLLILATFGLADIWAAPLSLRTVWLIRFGFACPPVVALLVLSLTPAYRRFMQPATALVLFNIGLSITLMVLEAQPSELSYSLYIFGITPVLVFIYIGPRLRFWYATVAGWAVIAASLSVIIGAPTPGDRPATLGFALSEVFLVAGTPRSAQNQASPLCRLVSAPR
jgi:hypothetical protein